MMKSRMIRMRCLGRMPLPFVLALLLLAGPTSLVGADPGVIYVAPEAACGAGHTPCYGSVQAAVDAAASGDEVRVATGTYTGVNNYGGLPQLAYISKTVTIRGGYIPVDWSISDPDANPTTLDVQGQGRVLYITGDISPTVENLTITGGDATGLGGNSKIEESGGGMCVISATAAIRNNRVFSNAARIGGGLFLYESSSTLVSNTITANAVTMYGGGLELSHSDATLIDNTITSNTTDFGGGGLSLKHSDAVLVGNRVSANAAYGGGGLAIWSSSITLSNNTIAYNTVDYIGGGSYIDDCDGTLSGNDILTNTASEGGGLFLTRSDSPILKENAIRGNVANSGSGLDIDGSTVTLSGNAIVANTAITYGGGLRSGQSTVTMTNNIISDNQANVAGSGLYLWCASYRLLHNTIAHNRGSDGSGVYVTHCYHPDTGITYGSATLTNTILVSHTVGISVTGGSTVTVNGILWHDTPVTISGGITAAVTIQNEHWGDPAFAGDGYHITPGSAGVDVGVGAGVRSDIDGHHRPYNLAPDLGADEIIATAVATNTGSSLVYTDTQDSPTTIQVPTEAVTEPITLVYTPLDAATPLSGFSFAGHAFDLEAYSSGVLLPSFTFEDPITITIHYTDADIAGLDEGTLVLRYWNGTAWSTDGITLIERNIAQNYAVFEVAHLSKFALFGETSVQVASVDKSVVPEGQVEYGEELTYTLVISATPGTQVGLYDPLEDTTFVDFVGRPEGVSHVDTLNGTIYLGGAITGTFEVTPTNQVTVSFVTKVGVPGTAGLTANVTNRACVYRLVGTLGLCTWSNEVTNLAFRPYEVYLPLLMRNN
jgi:hypothetical protein